MCPTCGQKVTGQRQVISKLRIQLKKVTGRHVSLSAGHAVACGNLETAQCAFEKAAAAITQWDNDWRKLDEQFSENFNSWEKRSNAYNAYLTATNKHAADLNALRAKLTDTTAAEAKAKLPKLQADVAQAREQYNTAVTTAGEKKSAVATAESSYKLLLQERSAASSRASVITESVKAKAELDVLKQAVEMVLDLQTKLVEAAVGPIVAACNRLCGGVLQHPLAYRDGEIGIASPKGFVTHRTMSGAERTLTRCAVSLALASEAPFRLAIIDEMGRLSRRNKKLVVANVIKLVKSGEIHQCMLVDTDEADYEPFEREFKDLFGVIRI